MKKPITLEYAKVYALAQFETFDKPTINRKIERKPFKRDSILKEYEESAEAKYQDNIFVDQDVIFEIDYIQKLMTTWNEIISAGEDYPFRDRVPPEYIENPFNFVFNTLSDAIRQKLIIDYCTDELYPKQESTQPEGLPCLYTTDKLKILFKKLMDAGNLIDKSVTETNFVATFQGGALPDGWKKIKWIGSKKKLSTFVWKLTREKPEPLDVKRIFIVKVAFDSRDCVTAKQIESKQHHFDIKIMFPDPE